MGRYKYEQFKGRFSDETIKAIISDLKGTDNFNEEDYDWNLLDIRVKRANKAQRHRFADTIRKLEEYIHNNPTTHTAFCNKDSVCYCDDTQIEILERFGTLKGDRKYVHLLTVREFSEITGRNRKTVTDWHKKRLISSCYINKLVICAEKAIEELKKINHP